MSTRLLIWLLLCALSVAGCSVAVKLSDTGLTIEWPKVPDLGLELPKL